MRKRIEKEYCDRCGVEIPLEEGCNYVFKSHSLKIKWHKMKFTILPMRLRKDDEIIDHHCEEDYDLCPKCAKEFVEWWEQGREK